MDLGGDEDQNPLARMAWDGGQVVVAEKLLDPSTATVEKSAPSCPGMQWVGRLEASDAESEATQEAGASMWRRQLA